MKKLTALLLCLVLCLSCVAAMASCDKTPDQPTDTTAHNNTTEAPTEDATEAPTDAEETTEAPADGDETQDPGDYDPESYVVITSPEDLMAFNKAVNEDMEYFDDMTVVFTNDIDMTGYEWIPLDGNALFGVTFEGNGHTISNLKFALHDPEQGTPADQMGSGFVGVAPVDMTFQNLTIDTASVVAYERAVGCFVGVQTGGSLWFENCNVKNFTAEGWMDWDDMDRAQGGHPISQRLGGFVGHNMAGNMTFLNCHVENLKMCGLQNLAGFVGYGSATLDEFCFEDCSVKNAELTFSYCMMEGKTIDMPKKYVAVFFNHAQWIDKTQACVDVGNTFEGISYYDWFDDNAEYTPSDLVSWDGTEPAA